MANPSSDLCKLIKQRSSIKATIQIIIDYTNNFNPLKQPVQQLQIRKKKLDSSMDALNEVQRAIADQEEGHEKRQKYYILKITVGQSKLKWRT